MALTETPNTTNAYRAEFGRGIELVSPRDADLIDRLRALPDRRWDPIAYRWIVRSVPANAAPLAALLEDFGFSVDPAVERELARMAAEARTAPVRPVLPARRIEVSGGDYAIYAPYDVALTGAIKAAFSVRTWDGENKRWLVPATKPTVLALRRLVAEWDLVIGADVAVHMDGVVGATVAAVAASRAEDAEIEIEGLGGTLRPFQRAGVAYALRARSTFIADEMGLGKTPEALATIAAANAFPALIIVPASLKLNWRKEANRWLPGRSVAIINGSAGEVPDADLVIINYDIAAKWCARLCAHRWGALVCDESHALKNSKAKRTLAIQEIAGHCGMRLLLSGTPLVNRPAELAPQLEILGRIDEFGGGWAFRQRYTDAWRDRFGWHFDGASNLDELQERLRSTCMVRRNKADVLTELPAKSYSTVPLELSNRKEYERAERELIAWLREKAVADRGFHARIAGLAKEDQEAARADDAEYKARQAEQLVRLNALRQLTGQGKLQAAREWIEGFVESGQKLILFTWHRELQAALMEAYPGAAHILGDDSTEERQAAVERFQADPECQLIVCSIRAAGVGHTLTAASNVAFLEMAWTPGDMSQCEDRAHRIGQTDAVTVWTLVAEGTVDEEMDALLASKRAVLGAVLDHGTAGNGGGESVQAELVGRLLDR